MRDAERGGQGMMHETSPSILIIRLDAIGDALALTPLLAALRARGLATDIVLTHANLDAFVPGAVRERYVAPFDLRNPSPENRRAIASFGELLQRQQYTHVLVATEDPSGYQLAADIGAPVRIGFHNGWGKPFKTLTVRRALTHSIFRTAGLDPRAPHECAVLFELGRTLLDDARPTTDSTLLQPLVARNGERGASVAFQLTDKFERLGIPADAVRATIAALADDNVHFLAPAAEASYARAIAGDAARLSIFDSVDAWKTAIASSQALIAPDSGAIHVAGMCGVPTVAIFPPQRHLDRQVARWHPWAAPYRIVVSDAGWPHDAAQRLRELV